MKAVLKVRELEIIFHSLGLSRNGHGKVYRNYYAAGDVDAQTCIALCELGLMTKVREPSELCPYPVFMVSKSGESMVSAYLKSFEYAPQIPDDPNADVEVPLNTVGNGA